MEPTPISPNGTNRLSERHKQIIVLIASDLTAKEIGDCLGISPRTVEFYRELIRQRLGVADNAGIVRYAIRVGMVQP